jgi:hypothetical protein
MPLIEDRSRPSWTAMASRCGAGCVADSAILVRTTHLLKGPDVVGEVHMGGEPVRQLHPERTTAVLSGTWGI